MVIFLGMNGNEFENLELTRQEVLKYVRFTNNFYHPYDGTTTNEYCNYRDLEILRYKKNDYVKVINHGDYDGFVTLERYKNGQFDVELIMYVYDLVDLTNCGYGFLKGKE